MKSTLDKILKLPEPSWDWNPGETSYTEFSPDEQDNLIAIINEEHLDEKMEDELSDPEEYASTHAYRILGSFLDPSHISLFLEWHFSPEFEDNDLFSEDIIKILPRYQSDAVQPCIDDLNDQELSETQRMFLCDVLFTLASNEIQSKSITQAFCDYLAEKHFSRTLNAHIITFLTNKDKDKHIDIIRDCFAAHLVDLSMAGDFEELEVTLGLREKRTTPCSSFFEAEEKELHLAIKQELGPRPSEDDPSSLFVYLLNLYSIDQGITEPFAIDGYLTAILLNPTPQRPSDFLPKFWDRKEQYSPAWEDENDAVFFTDFLLAVHNKIADDLQRRALDPMLEYDNGNKNCPLYITWISGFLHGFHAWHGDGELDNDDLPELEDSIIFNLFQILLIESNASESNERPKTRSIVKDLKTAIYKLFKQNQTDLADNPFNPLASTKREPKISRNSPCPCGSGKKYKRCCMN